MGSFLDTCYVEELDHDFAARISFDFQPAEPDVGIMDSYIEHVSVELMYAEGWTVVENLDESTLNEKCWAFIKMQGERGEDAKLEAAEAQREEEKLYENR